MNFLRTLLTGVAALALAAPSLASPVRLDFGGKIEHVSGSTGIFFVGELLTGSIFYDTAVAPEAKTWLYTEYPVGQTTIDYKNGIKPGDFSDTSADAFISSSGALSFVGVDYDKKDGLSAFALLLNGKFPTTSLPGDILGMAGILPATLYGKWADDGKIVLFDAKITSLTVTPVSAVPLPAAFLLFGSGFLGLLGFRRFAPKATPGTPALA